MQGCQQVSARRTNFIARGIARTALVALVLFAFPPAGASALPDYRGVQLHSLWWDSSDQDMDRELDLARDAHSNVVRVDVSWSSLETAGEGQLSQWYVDKLDRFVAGADARGLKVIATLFDTPCWASSAPDSLKQGCQGAFWDRGVTNYPPLDDSKFANIAKWVTSRYGSKLGALEIWNEPNLGDGRFWISDDPAGRYAELVKAAYPAAKAGDPSVPVLAGALAFSDRPFLESLYAHGIKGFYDGSPSTPTASGGARARRRSSSSRSTRSSAGCSGCARARWRPATRPSSG